MFIVGKSFFSETLSKFNMETIAPLCYSYPTKNASRRAVRPTILLGLGLNPLSLKKNARFEITCLFIHFYMVKGKQGRGRKPGENIQNIEGQF